MSRMKNPILGIENMLVGQLFKRVSIFEKKIYHDLKFWIFDFFMLFSHRFLRNQRAVLLNFDLLGLEC